MIIRKSNATESGTKISDVLLDDDRLSYRALGILINILGRPDDWVFNQKELKGLRNDTSSSIHRCLKELRQFGYLQSIPIRKNGKLIRWETVVVEKPYR